MTVSLSALRIRAVVLDIEGTTTPVDFVYKILFPYARAHAAEYLAREWDGPACREVVALLRDEHRLDVEPDYSPATDFTQADAAAYVVSLMDQDRKSRGLKMLQGLVWKEGYRRGELRGQVYPDVQPALERWAAQGLRVCIYSSGSVLAQQLLFGSTNAGDLLPFLSGHFDTAVGPKTSVASYAHIVQALGVEASEVLFVSDVAAELDAASISGLHTVLCARPSVEPPAASDHPSIRTFDEIAN